MSQPVVVHPHHPDCRGNDPERCCYCAALLRREREPLDFRYGGPGCYCKPPEDPCS